MPRTNALADFPRIERRPRDRRGEDAGQRSLLAFGDDAPRDERGREEEREHRHRRTEVVRAGHLAHADASRRRAGSGCDRRRPSRASAAIAAGAGGAPRRTAEARIVVDDGQARGVDLIGVAPRRSLRRRREPISCSGLRSTVIAARRLPMTAAAEPLRDRRTRPTPRLGRRASRAAAGVFGLTT